MDGSPPGSFIHGVLQTRKYGHHHKNLQMINAAAGVEKREPSYTVGGNANGHNHYGGTYGSFLKKQNRTTI